ncbi:DUF6875 domain-containing protein [Streptomyces sp. NPDC003233]
MTVSHGIDPAVVASAERSLMRWLREFVAAAHPGLGRSGAVCPFVGPALRAGTLKLRPRSVGPDLDDAGLRTMVRESVLEFLTTSWPTTNRALHTLVVMMPDLSEERAVALDTLHREMKDELVGQGLMFAQFHPRCDERSVRNPTLKVADSPVPMLAIRHMASHDIMFLHERPEWVAAYTAAFGHLYDSATSVDPFLAECFDRALDKHGGPHR